ncbi:MAG: DUF3010 family protein [Syntrophobacteraceae bacterium]
MIICGTEIAGNSIVFALLDLTDSGWSILEYDIKKLVLENPSDQAEVKSFKDSVEHLMARIGVNAIVIKSRKDTGKFSGSGTSFKIEGLVQLIEGIEVILLSPNTIASIIKKHPVSIPKELYKYQHEAFKAAYCYTVR